MRRVFVMLFLLLVMAGCKSTWIPLEEAILLRAELLSASTGMKYWVLEFDNGLRFLDDDRIYVEGKTYQIFYRGKWNRYEVALITP